MSDGLTTWLNQELEQRGWSQAELARRADVSRPLVTRTLSGDMPASADFCIKVAQALGEAPEKILRLAGILPASADDDPTLAELQDIVKNLPPSQRKEALRYLRYLYQSGKAE